MHFAIRSNGFLRLLVCILMLLHTVVFSTPATANPSGADVVAGSAAINAQGNTLNVVTGSDRTIINWQDFSIGANEATNFTQPGANSAVLNRVTGGNPSAIYGQLNSNGNVFLINPNGIFIGPSGVINVNGFTASTFDIANQDFLDGAPFNFQGSSLESVINEGRIHTGAGGAALLGHNVTNHGTITSDGGAITLATGGSITLNDGSRYIQADINTLTNGLSETASLIKQSGTVRATGALKTGGEVYLVNPNGNILHDGTIHADKLAASGERTGGSVKLEAKQGATTVAGTIDVSGETGGRAEVLGQQVELAGANIDASGTTGGGEVLVGGDLRGDNPDVANALSTKVDAASQVNVDSTESGNAGRAIYYAEEATEYFGHTSAAARGATGDGGFVEVSGGNLGFYGSVDLSSTGGEVGTVLLDPANFVADSSNIVSLRNAWGSGNLLIEATQSVTIEEDLFPAISGNEIVTGTSNTLTVQHQVGTNHDLDIVIDAAIRNGNGTQTVGTQRYYSANGNFEITSNGEITSRSTVFVYAGTIDLNGPISNDGYSLYLTAYDNADVGIGTSASGVFHLTDDEVSQLDGSSYIYFSGGDFDIRMSENDPFSNFVYISASNSGPANGSINVESLYGQQIQLFGDSVSIDAFDGSHLSIYTPDLSINGTLNGSGTFYYDQRSNQSLGIGDNATGDIVLLQADIDQLGSFNNIALGRNSSTGSALDINQADLSAFGSMELKGSSITINDLAVGQSLYLVTDQLNVNSPVTKASSGGTLRIRPISGKDIGIGDGTTGDIVLSQSTLANLGSYSQLYVENYNSTGNLDVDADLSGFSSGIYATINGDIEIRSLTTPGSARFYGNEIVAANIDAGGGVQLYARGNLEVGNVTTNSNVELYGDDIQIVGAIVDQTPGSTIYLGTYDNDSTTLTLGTGPSADWVVDETELGMLSGFSNLYVYGHNSGVLHVDADLASVLEPNGDVYLRSGDVTIAALAVSQDLTIRSNAVDIQSQISVDNASARFYLDDYDSSTIGLGDTASGAIHLTQQELDYLANFPDLRFYGTNGVDIQNITVASSLDIDASSSSGDITVDGLSITDPTRSLYLQARKVIGGGVSTGGHVNIRGYQGLHGDNGGRFTIDRLSTTNQTYFYNNSEGDIYVEIDNPGTNDHYFYNANGSIDVLANGSVRFDQIDARDPDMVKESEVILSTTSGDITFLSPVYSATDITVDSAGKIVDSYWNAYPLYAPGEIQLMAVAGIEGSNGGYFDVEPDKAINATTTGDGANIMLQTYTGGNLVLGEISTNNGTLFARNGYHPFYNSGDIDAQGTINTGGADIRAADNVYITTLNASDDVLVQAGDDITVRANTITLTDGANIAMRSLGDIHLNGSVQNASAAGGDVNLIAGWDGTTGAATPFDMTHIFLNESSFGNNDGGVFIGDGLQTAGIAVGSRFGETNVAAGSLTLRGGVDRDAFSQLGFQSRGTASLDTDGAITISLSDESGNGGNLLAIGGRGIDSYAQIGNGGRESLGNQRGDITIIEANDIDFLGGTGIIANAQLGHGGSNANITASGDIIIHAANNITFQGSSVGPGAFSRFGHGGQFNAVNANGLIEVKQANHFIIQGGRDSAFAQVGHGGLNTSGIIHGDIRINVAELTLAGGTASNAFALLGHGSNGEVVGDIDVRVAGETSLVNGSAGNTSWLLGHRSANGITPIDGDVTLITGTLDYDADNPSTQVTLNQDFADKMVANLAGGQVTIAATNGTTGPTGGMVVDGAFLYDSPHHLSLLSTTDVRFNASVQNSNNDRGDVNVVAGWDGASGVVNPLDSTDFGPFNPADFLTADVSEQDLYGLDGDVEVWGALSRDTAVGSRSGSTNIFGRSVRVLADFNSAAQIGYQATDMGNLRITGDINIRAVHALGLIAGNNDFAYAQVGHVGADPVVDSQNEAVVEDAVISVVLGQDLLIQGGNALGAYAQLGHGGYNGDGNFDGDITITAAEGIVVEAPQSGNRSHAQIGHGGLGGDGNHTGNITIEHAEYLGLVAGGGEWAYAQLGHGGHESDGSAEGNIHATVNSLELHGRAVNTNYAMIGHGDEPGDGDVGHAVSGEIVLNVASGIALTTGVIGHRIDSNGTYTSGNTHIAVGTNNYAGSNTTDALVSDSRCQIVSAPDGELRLYLPRRSSFQMADGATLNGTDVATFNDSTPFPNEQGGHQPFVGPYDIDANDGNFAFYYSLIELFVQAGSGSSEYGEPTTDPGWIVTNEVLSEAELASLGLTTDFALTNESDADVYTVNVIGDSQNPNYEIVQREEGTYTITRAPLTINVLDQTKTYGDDLTSQQAVLDTHFTVDGLKNNDVIDSIYLDSDGYDSTASVVGGPYDIQAGDIVPGDNFKFSNYDISYDRAGVVFVDPFELSVGVNAISKEYGETVPLDGSTGFTVTPFYNSNDPLPNGEIVTSLALQSAGAAADADVGSYGINLVDVYGSNGFDSSNYSTANYVPIFLTVTPAPLVVRALDQTKTYGDDLTGQTPELGTHFTVDGLKLAEEVETVGLTSAGYDPTASVAGGPYDIVVGDVSTVSGSNGFNRNNYYIAETTDAQLTVDPFVLDIVVDPISKEYGETVALDGSTGFSVGPLPNNQAITSLQLQSAGATADADVIPGGYTVNLVDVYGSNGFDSSNYSTANYVPAILTVTPAPLVVRALDQTKTYGDDLTGQTPELGTHFTVRGLKNNEVVDGVTLVSDGYDPTASVNDGPYAIVASGPTDSTGSGFDTSNYAVTFRRGQLTVNPATLIVTALDQTKTYGDDLTGQTPELGTHFTVRGLKNNEVVDGVTLASNGYDPTASVNGGPYAIVASGPTDSTGSGFETSNYAITFRRGQLTVNPATLIVTALDQTKTYGDDLTGQTPELGTHFTVRGLKNDEVVDGVTLASGGYDPTASVNGGPYAIIASGPTDSAGSGFESSNYDITFRRGRLTVNPADLLIFANNQFKRSGIALTLDETSGFTAVGLVNGETINSVALASAGAPAAAPAGVYTIGAGLPVSGSADLANYNVRFATGLLIVAEVSGEYTYDQFVRAEDQWRTIDALLAGIYYRGDIRYGDNPTTEEGDGNLVQMNSFDLFD